MNNPAPKRLFNLMHYTWALLVVWTIIVSGLLAKEVIDIKTATRAIALNTARAHLNKEKAFRFWAYARGGVYVPVTKNLQPNPYLKIPERDITTPSGRRLTLMNPEYMLRDLNNTFSGLYGVAGHLTSLNPLRPANKPDHWETQALKSFARGNKEAVAIVKNKKDGSEALRLMQPLFVRPICLRCHGQQGYKLGDVRGGIGITLPMNAFLRDANRQITVHAISLLLLWLIGDFGIISGSSRLKKRTEELARSNLDLQREIEVRTKTETALQQESSFTAAILNTAAALILVLDPQGQIIRCNQTSERLTGYSMKEMKNKRFSDILLPATEAQQINEAFANIHEQPFPQKLELHIITKDNQHLAIECSNTIFTSDSGKIEYIISIGIDISDERQLQEQLLHAEKLSAVGKLSASIAHEINNPLFGIRNVLELLLDKGQLDNSNQEFAKLAVAECDRIKSLIKNLQDFNRPTSGIMTTVDLTTTINNMLMLTKKEMKNKGITVCTDYEPNMPPIQAISDQIKQVLLNLLNNAMESCGPGSRVTISTRKISNQAIIKITDTGNGIPAENLPHIFEPFFTTKAAVKGTGLGLSVSYGIIKRHQGDIKVESELGQGTVFTITLPISRKPT